MKIELNNKGYFEQIGVLACVEYDLTNFFVYKRKIQNPELGAV